MPPLTVMIKPVSGACNMRCQYCFYADEMVHRSVAVYPPMTQEMLSLIVRRCMMFADLEVSFAFQGGEPTLAGLDYYRELIRQERQYNTRGLRVNNLIQTNGYDISDEMIRFFAEEQFLVGLSMDGTEQAHDAHRRDAKGDGTYGRVLNCARRMEEAGVRFNILCVVNHQTAMQSRKILSELKRYRYIQFIPCIEPIENRYVEYALKPEEWGGFLIEAYDEYERAFRIGKPLHIRHFDNWMDMLMGVPPEDCSMSGQCQPHFVFESNGDVYPCDFYMTDAWKMGNIADSSLRSLLKSPVVDAFCRTSRAVPETCHACEWYALCRNGCRKDRAEDGLCRWCTSNKMFFEQRGKRMKELAMAIWKREAYARR